MKYKMTFYFAMKDVNNFMESVDMKSKDKWFVSPLDTSFTREEALDEKFFDNMMEKSRANDEFWIPAIEFCGTLYVHPTVKELSDGEKILYVRGGTHVL